MNKAITVELQFFLISIFSGTLILLVYDGFRIVRRLIKHNEAFLAIEDLIFWVAASVFIFAMMYQENSGIIRGFSVMGMTIGMVLYHYILSDLFVEMITKLLYTLFRPIIYVFNKVKGILLLIHIKYKKLMHFLLLRLKKVIKSVRITLNERRMKRLEKRELQREKETRDKQTRDKVTQEKKTQEKKTQEKKTQDRVTQEKKTEEKKKSELQRISR